MTAVIPVIGARNSVPLTTNLSVTTKTVNFAESVQVSHLERRRPITFSFLARLAKSSALLARSACTALCHRKGLCHNVEINVLMPQRGNQRAYATRGGRPKRAEDFACRARNEKVIGRRRSRCDTCKHLGRFGGRFGET